MRLHIMNELIERMESNKKFALEDHRLRCGESNTYPYQYGEPTESDKAEVRREIEMDRLKQAKAKSRFAKILSDTTSKTVVLPTRNLPILIHSTEGDKGVLWIVETTIDKTVKDYLDNIPSSSFKGDQVEVNFVNMVCVFHSIVYKDKNNKMTWWDCHHKEHVPY